jgi:hypothetical protein
MILENHRKQIIIIIIKCLTPKTATPTRGDSARRKLEAEEIRRREGSASAPPNWRQIETGQPETWSGRRTQLSGIAFDPGLTEDDREIDLSHKRVEEIRLHIPNREVKSALPLKRKPACWMEASVWPCFRDKLGAYSRCWQSLT